jgi:hypothetical protein
VRLELCDFLLVAALRLALLAQLLRAFHGLAFPRITTAQDLRVLKHRTTESWRSLAKPPTYQILRASSSTFCMSFTIQKPEPRKPLKSADFDSLDLAPATRRGHCQSPQIGHTRNDRVTSFEHNDAAES